jgi:tyrosinase
MDHKDWGVHTMGMGGTLAKGRNFLAWHRRFLAVFEKRLQQSNPTVTIPYWDSVTDRSIPAALSDPALLSRWSVSRSWDPSKLAHASDLNAVKNYTGSFTGFQTLLEGAIHADTHDAVGGNMQGSTSPTDPLFWLHHAFIDKTWANWQASANGKAPPHPTEILKPADMQPGIPFGVRIDSLLSIATLGYSYA